MSPINGTTIRVQRWTKKDGTERTQVVADGCGPDKSDIFIHERNTWESRARRLKRTESGQVIVDVAVDEEGMPIERMQGRLVDIVDGRRVSKREAQLGIWVRVSRGGKEA